MAGGDAEALAALYDRYSPVVMALFVRMLGSRAEAEDLLQEVFIEAWRRAGSFDRARGSAATWLLVLARSRALDRLRSGARRRAGRSRLEVDPAAGATAVAPALPSESVELARRRTAVRSAVAALTAPQREALELSYYAGLSHAEIAEQIEVPLGTVKSRIIAAMRQLRCALADVGGDA